MRQITLQQVLRLILLEASGGSGLTFYVDGGVIEVTTTEVADNQLLTKVYNVQDLLIDPPGFVEPPDFDLSSNNSYPRGNGRTNTGTANGRNRYNPRNMSVKPDELVNLIVDTIQPTNWMQNGGKASIRLFNGNLIVTATRSMHEAIGGPID
jgi:hypothetical protein